MTIFPLRSMAASAFVLLLLGISPVFAGDDTVRAEAYFSSITGGDAETIASFYADDAEFRWIGGPLAGLYKGRDQIKGVWTRFSEAAGSFTHEVLELSETAKGPESVITARVAFKGATAVPVKFLITYKDGKITSETWQVDKSPNAMVKTEPNPAPPAKPLAANPEAMPTAAPAEVKPAPVAKVEPKPEPKPTPASKPETATLATVEPSSAPTEKPAADEQPDYLPRGARSAPSATKPAAPAEAKPASKAKTAGPKRKKRNYEDNDYGYGYGNEYPPRRYRDYDDDYGYGGGYRSYGYRGYGGFWGGYGRYGGGYGY
jgi:ketosteroid isomerase-like protein